MTAYIHSCGDIYYSLSPADETLPDLKDLVVDAVGQPIRRVSRFMQLAIVGAGRCAKNVQLPSDTAVYLASGRGDLEITLDVMNHVFRESQSPKPLSFVNTVSNAACFYVAKCLNLAGRSNFVCSRYFAFERALQLALVDLNLGAVTSALVGAVDTAVTPIDAHRKRLGVDELAPLGEASHWLWLTLDKNRAHLGAVTALHNAIDRSELLLWLAQQNFSRDTCLSGGQFISTTDLKQIQNESGLTQTFDYRELRGYYDSQSAAAIGEFLSATNSATTMLHIQSDPAARYTALRVEKKSK